MAPLLPGLSRDSAPHLHASLGLPARSRGCWVEAPRSPGLSWTEGSCRPHLCWAAALEIPSTLEFFLSEFQNSTELSEFNQETPCLFSPSGSPPTSSNCPVPLSTHPAPAPVHPTALTTVLILMPPVTEPSCAPVPGIDHPLGLVLSTDAGPFPHWTVLGRAEETDPEQAHCWAQEEGEKGPGSNSEA
jgi:hypothetical protein